MSKRDPRQTEIPIAPYTGPSGPRTELPVDYRDMHVGSKPGHKQTIVTCPVCKRGSIHKRFSGSDHYVHAELLWLNPKGDVRRKTTGVCKVFTDGRIQTKG